MIIVIIDAQVPGARGENPVPKKDMKNISGFLIVIFFLFSIIFAKQMLFISF